VGFKIQRCIRTSNDFVGSDLRAPCCQRQKLQLTQGGRLTEDPEQRLVLGLLTSHFSCNVRARDVRWWAGFQRSLSRVRLVKRKADWSLGYGSWGRIMASLTPCPVAARKAARKMWCDRLLPLQIGKVNARLIIWALKVLPRAGKVPRGGLRAFDLRQQLRSA